MVLPLIFSALGSALGGAGALGGIGALGGAAIGSGLGTAVETGDLEKGILSGLGAFAGGTALGALTGGAAGAAGSEAAKGAMTMGNPTAMSSQIAKGGIQSVMPPASALGPTGVQKLLGQGAVGTNAQRVMDFAGSKMGMATGIGGMVGSSLAGQKGQGSETYGNKGSGDTEMSAIPRPLQTPGAGYRPGFDPEFDYGVGKVPTAGQVLNYRDKGVNPYRMAGGGLLSSLQGTFGPIHMAEGGIADLAQSMDGGDMAASQMGGNEKDVVAEAVRAVKGESQSPEIALGKFLAQYGEEALRELVDKVQSGEMDDTVERSEGRLRGAGDGMDDLIPANVGGDQDVLLSDGEFIVPADVVSGLGNGSSDAGARELERMMERVRTSRHGSPDQPPQIDRKMVVPA
jgi:hypothetical protein